MILRINAKKFSLNTQVFLVSFMLGVFFFQGYFIDQGVSENIKYVLDVLNVALLITVLKRSRRINAVNKGILVLYAVLGVSGSLVMLVNADVWETNILYWMLDCRNLLRFPIFLIACNMLLREKDVEFLFKGMLLLQPVNTVLIIYQYFTVEVWAYWMRGDNLNGFFGTRVGGNQYLNVFLLAVTMIAYAMWKWKKIRTKWFLLCIGTCLLDAALAELKAYFVEIILIMALFWLTEKRWKKITRSQLVRGMGFLFIGVVGLYFMVQMLYKLYPIFNGSLSLDKIISIAVDDAGYTGSGDLNRLNAVSGVFQNIFGGDILRGLFGLGIGSAYTGGNMTRFAHTYFDTHYSWFSSSYMFVETGFLGLVLYAGTFFYCYAKCKKNNMYGSISKVTSIMAVFLIIYNEVLKTEGGYLVYFLISAGFIAESREIKLKQKR